MKKLALALVALFVTTIQASAMSYEQACEQALFLTDKMAYELNLTDDQYEAAYEINLDYLMGVNAESDLYGPYWTQRNLDLSYVLWDWQYQLFLNASYFYRPLYWYGGFWHFGIYARYPHRDFFYFGRPHFFGSYRGAHGWHMNGGRSWYKGREFGGPRNGQARVGMRDGYDRGNFGRGGTLQSTQRRSSANGQRGVRSSQSSRGNISGQRSGARQSGSRSVGNNSSMQSRSRSVGNNSSMQSRSRMSAGSRESSTRTTATRQSGSRTFGSNSRNSSPRNTFTPSSSRSRSSVGATGSASRSSAAGRSSMRSSSRSAGRSAVSGSAPSRSASSARSSSSRSSGGSHSSSHASGGSHSGGGHSGGGHSGGGHSGGGH